MLEGAIVMAEEKKKIGELLVEAGLITQEQVQKVLEIQKSNPDRKFGEVVVNEGFIDKKTLTEFLLDNIK